MNLPNLRSSALTANTAERIRGVVTPLNLHFTGVALLLLINAYLLIHMGITWQTLHSQDEDALSQQRVQLQTARIAALPLQGLDRKLVKATDDSDRFYDRRLPYAISQVAAELGALAKQQNVKLTRTGYAYSPILQDASLTQVRIDASLSGDYRPLVQVINNLERDKMFFLISGVALTGQQSGTVNLRLGLTTYLRPAHGDEARGEEKLSENPDEKTAPTPAVIGTPQAGAAGAHNPIPAKATARGTAR